MWKLSEIKIRNIVSFKDAQLTITQGVATLIFGKNEDNASQPCNGSGKSSLIEAISFALTGMQLRDVKSVEEIINDYADDAYVYLKLENDYDHTSFTIERTISRTAPQSIECHKYDESGKEIEVDKTIQPTVADYNKFILGEIGLSKDDIYNNYILCDNKYESFFDCSDKNKKEIINRFSNGVIVDESIARVQADMEPVETQLIEINNKVINIKGSISAIENELVQVDEKRTNARAERQQRIDRLDDQILKCRDEIATIEDKKKKGKDRLELLKDLQAQVNLWEESESSVTEAYHNIKLMCEKHDLEAITDYELQSISFKERLDRGAETLKSIKQQVEDASNKVAECQKAYNTKNALYLQHTKEQEELSANDRALIAKINDEIISIDEKLDNIETQIKEHKSTQVQLETSITRNAALLDGAITCPKCSYKFLLNNDVTVDEVKTELKQLKTAKDKCQSEIEQLNKDFDLYDEQAATKSGDVDALHKKIKSRSVTLSEEYSALTLISKDLGEAERTVATLNKQMTIEENELDKIHGKIEVMRNRLFGEINGILDGRVSNGENYIAQLASNIEFYQGQLHQYQQSKRELLESPETDFTSSLQSSLNKYQEELATAEQTMAEIQSEYNILKKQEVDFVMFKSYIARKKIDALSLIVNDFLEKIGSDIRLKLEGFTVTKTGKLRDKISVQVMRDGVDCGSYHKFSGGEKARLNLACILSLHTLTNSNCEDGKGLDFIIIDELLDKSDEMGMTTYCDALNKLGQTALLITQGGVSESYPHKLLIVKQQGISTISN